MKRNVIISGEFTVTELANAKKAIVSAEPSVVIKGKKASERLEILKAAGIDTSNLFAMGDEMVVRVVDGVPTQVLDDDPVFAMINKGGHVPDRRLFRRWVMAQMFRMLRQMDEYKMTFTDIVRNHGYEYMWKMVVEELRVQARLYKAGDTENLNERKRFFNAEVVLVMMDEYAKRFDEYVDSLKVKHCKGKEYKTIHGTHVFVDDIPAKLTYKTNSLRDRLKNEMYNIEPDELHLLVSKFNKARTTMKWNTEIPKAFIDAYKGAGAFYTMKDLILFHGCQFRERGRFVGKERSMKLLEKYSITLNGWELLGVMKELIKENGISIEKKIAEWKKK